MKMYVIAQVLTSEDCFALSPNTDGYHGNEGATTSSNSMEPSRLPFSLYFPRLGVSSIITLLDFASSQLSPIIRYRNFGGFRFKGDPGHPPLIFVEAQTALGLTGRYMGFICSSCSSSELFLLSINR